MPLMNYEQSFLCSYAQNFSFNQANEFSSATEDFLTQTDSFILLSVQLCFVIIGT